MPYDVTDQIVRHELFPQGGYQDVMNEVQLVAAARFVCYSWIAEATKTLAGIRIGIGNTAGTLTNGLTWNIYAGDSAGLPTGASLQSGTVTPAGYTNTVLACTQALTLGSRYALVIQNVLGTPGSNYFATPFGASMPAGMSGIASISLDSGTTYLSRVSMMPPIQLSYNDGSRYGSACPLPIATNSTGYQLYNASGSRFSLAGVRFQPHYRRGICEVVGRFRVVGTLASAGALACRIYNGTTLLATSDNTVAFNSNTGTGAYGTFFFGTPLIIDPSMVVAVTFGQSAATGGDGSNYFMAVGNSAVKYAPTGVADCAYEGWHTVTSTASALSAWTVGGDNQVYAAISSRVVSNRRYF